MTKSTPHPHPGTLRRRPRLVILDNAGLDNATRLRETWRHGISLEPSQPSWANGTGRELKWED